jgi:hypothetical protein
VASHGQGGSHGRWSASRLVILYAPDAGPYYLGAAVVMAFAQLITWSGFRQTAQTGDRG